MNRLLQFVFSFMTLMVFSIGTSWSQSLPCNDRMNISISNACEVTITPQTMHSTNDPSWLVRIKISDFGLVSTIPTAGLNAIFPGATIGGTGADRYVELSSLVIRTNEITASRTMNGRGSFSAAGMWTTKVSVVNGTNSCWGTVMIEDKIPAIINGPADITVSCLAPVDAKGNPTLAVTGDITTTGSCSDAIKKGFVDQVVDSKCSSQSLVLKQITRIFIVENPKGFQTRDTQNITVLAVDVEETLEGPNTLVEIKCNQGHTPADIATILGDGSYAYPYV
ncbi:MAG TPA: hypothetical protein PKD85_17900, partial [Saprospiraceae bacterium]|nr:hypothetical protein [Saprospiraceae bacterium]